MSSRTARCGPACRVVWQGCSPEGCPLCRWGWAKGAEAGVKYQATGLGWGRVLLHQPLMFGGLAAGPVGGRCRTGVIILLPWGRSSAGRARRSQCRGREFDPPRLHHPHSTPDPSKGWAFLFVWLGQLFGNSEKLPSGDVSCVHGSHYWAGVHLDMQGACVVHTAARPRVLEVDP